MLTKLFAAALCGIVIASIASHADAAGPGTFARGFGALERTIVESSPSVGDSEKVDLERKKTLSALNHYFSGFDKSHQPH